MNRNSIVNETLNEIADIFTTYSDITFTTDTIINHRMRELMLSNQALVELTHTLLYSKSSENEVLLCKFIRMSSHGWFNYDRYLNQYAEPDLDEVITFFVSETITKKSVEYQFACLAVA